MKLYNTFLVSFFPAAFLSIALCFCFHIPSLTFSNIINFTSYDNIKYLYNYYVKFSPNNSELQVLPKRFSNTDIDNIKEFFEVASKSHYERNFDNAFLYYSKIDNIFSKPSEPTLGEVANNQNNAMSKTLSKTSILRIKYQINMGRGSIRHEQGRIKEALKYFVVASTFKPEDISLLSMVSHLANKAKQYNLAYTYYTKWVERDRNNAEPWYFLATYLEKKYDNNRNIDALNNYLMAIDVLKKNKIPRFETIKSMPSSSISNEFLIWNSVYHGIGRLLRKMNRNNEAEDYYDQGYKYKLWPHPLRRFVSINRRPKYDSLPYIPSSNYKFYPREIVQLLENNYRSIKVELFQFIAASNDTGATNHGNKKKKTHLLSFALENETLHNNGTWQQLRIYENRRYNNEKDNICYIFKKTCTVFDKVILYNEGKCRSKKMVRPDACSDLMIYFSKLSPGTIIRPHCGPSFRRLRIHLGIAIPEPQKTSLNLANNVLYQWKEGEVFVFDDSFEHSVQHEGVKDRIILVIDVVHPNEYL
jgi:tetratricopeptide (TPR) repeat protein